MSEQLLVRIDVETKKKFYRFVRMEGKTASEKMREMVDEYIRKRDIGTAVDSLWERIGDKIQAKGFAESDVDSIIRETRKSR